MTEPKDQEIVTWLRDVFGTINDLSGYHSTVPLDRIFTEEAQLPDPADNELMVFLDDSEEETLETRRAGRMANLTVIAHVTVPIPANAGTGDVPTPRQSLRRLFADFRKALAPYGESVDTALAGVPKGLKSLTFARRRIDLLADGSDKQGGEMQIQLTFQELHDPT